MHDVMAAQRDRRRQAWIEETATGADRKNKKTHHIIQKEDYTPIGNKIRKPYHLNNYTYSQFIFSIYYIILTVKKLQHYKNKIVVALNIFV